MYNVQGFKWGIIRKYEVCLLHLPKSREIFEKLILSEEEEQKVNKVQELSLFYNLVLYMPYPYQVF
jgi:hypothetical protein